MLVTELGIVTLVRLLHPEKAQSPMLVTELGIVTLVILLQSEKAQSPMLVTELGIVTSPPAPVYSVSTPYLILKSPSANTFMLPAPDGRNSPNIASTSTIDTIRFFIICFSSLSCRFSLFYHVLSENTRVYNTFYTERKQIYRKDISCHARMTTTGWRPP
jgi:hypothetical protein